MKFYRYISAAALFALGAACVAAQVKFSAGVDYTTYGVTQTKTTTDGEFEKTKASSGYDPDGNMTIDVLVNAASMEFNLGLYFNADGGNQEYYDFGDKLNTSFYKGNLKAGFFADQVSLYLGKFEDFNADFIVEGYALGEQYITNLADKYYGQYLTGLLIEPQIFGLNGLRLFAGCPILPQNGNGIPDAEYDQWNVLYKKFKFAASYTLDNNIAIIAGFRPGTYFDGVDEADSGEMALATSNFTESLFSEGFVQVSLPNVIDGLKANASYDIRYRDGTYTNTANETEEHKTFAHMLGVSAEFGDFISPDLTLAVEDRAFFADDDYITSDEKLLYDILALSAEYNLITLPFNIGLNAAGMYGVDARGMAFTDNNGAKIATGRYYCDKDIGMSLNDMATASVSGLSGKSSQYFGLYANPYIRVKMSGGSLKIGAEFCLTKFKNEDVENTGFSYRIPVGLKFAF